MDYIPPSNGDLENPARPYVDADLVNGVDGSRPTAAYFNSVIGEIVAAITALGGVPSNETSTQLGERIVASIAAAVATRVAKAGDTMIGPLTLAGNPTANLHAATKQYVDGAHVFSPNGYMKFADGFLVQWGTTNTNSSGAASVTFPITFPNNVFVAMTTDIGNDAPGLCYGGTSINNNSNMGLTFARNALGANAVSAAWLAIGY